MTTQNYALRSRTLTRQTQLWMKRKMPRLRKWLAHNCGLVRSIQIWSILIAIACMGIFTGYMLSQAGSTATVAEVRAEYQAQLGRDRTGYLARINGQRDTIAQLRDLLGKNLDSMQNVLADNTTQLQTLTDKVSTASTKASKAASSAQSASVRASSASTQATKAVSQAVTATRKVEMAAEVLDKVTDNLTPLRPSGDVPDWLNTP